MNITIRTITAARHRAKLPRSGSTCEESTIEVAVTVELPQQAAKLWDEVNAADVKAREGAQAEFSGGVLHVLQSVESGEEQSLLSCPVRTLQWRIKWFRKR